MAKLFAGHGHLMTEPSLLLEQLRARGIVIGTAELQRLQTVFTHQPTLAHDELCGLFCALLAKDAQQRAVVRMVFERLVPRDATAQPGLPSPLLIHLPASAVAPQDEPAEEQAPPAPKLPPNWARISLGLWVAAILLIVWLASMLVGKEDQHGSSSQSRNDATTQTINKPAAVTPEIKSALKLQPEIELWTPVVKAPQERQPWPLLIPALLLLAGGGLGFVGLLYKTQKIIQQRPARRPLTPKGARGRCYHLRPDEHAYKLLNGQERQAVASGISQRFSPLPLRHLDIQRTVTQSARLAIPHVIFQQSQQTREVWLWQEQASNNPDLAQLADEISRTLRAVNIVVQRAYFRGIPRPLRNEQGEVLHDIEQQRQPLNPLVLIFFDATVLGQYQQRRGSASERVLQAFGRWPHTAAVDAGEQPGRLQAYLKPYQLTCLLPDAVAHWLAQQDERLSGHNDSPDREQLQQWALACALSYPQVIEDEARALHDALGLSSHWHYPLLKHYNPKPRHELEFGTNRITLLNHFGRYVQSGQRWPALALAFWRKHYQALDQQHLQDEQDEQRPDARAVWQGTHKQLREINLKQALLSLWDDPEAAAGVLYDLHDHEALRAEIEQHLAQYRFADQPATVADEQHVITLPCSWQSLKLESQRQLLACGLGQAPRLLKVYPDGFTRRLSGISLGLALAGLVVGLWAVYPRAPAFQLQANSAQPPASARVTAVWTGSSAQHAYRVGTEKSIFRSATGIEEDHQVPLRWQRKVVPAQQVLTEDESVQLWRLGERAAPLRPVTNGEQQDWPHWSLAVMGGDAEQPVLQELAAKLLDTGSVDQVLLGYGAKPQAQQQYAEWLEAARGLDTQWVYIQVANPPSFYTHPAQRIAVFADPARLLAQLQQSNALIKATRVGGVLQKEQAVWLKGEKQYPVASNRAEILLANQLKLLRIPAGTFQMGSEKYDNEKPLHPVTFASDFYMSQTEVTFAQYDAYVAAMQAEANSPVSKKVEVPESPADDGWGRADRPVINVSWHDAQGYLRWLTETQQPELQGLQCRLPSESEWEYAARAGTTTAYSWGEAIENNRANCDGCGSEWDNKQTAPVGSFAPNSWGLYDMHGNVWEWVQDRWHGNYNDAPADGSAWESGDGGRVLRGGSWLYTPVSLRAAIRDGYNPDFRSYDRGFRVVCSSPFER